MESDRIKNLKAELLSDNWAKLEKYTYDYQNFAGAWETQVRESYDRGNGVAVYLYNPERQKVLLTRQFRLPTYLNGNSNGLMVEVAAGVMEPDGPEESIKREILEETGYAITQIEKCFEAYMSPGSVTEIIHFYLAEYNENQRQTEGGGADYESEDIEVLEWSYDRVKEALTQGEIKDAKTMMLIQHAMIQGII
ncbi:NUDIX domain-containing protein [Sediminicola luteus]|uniref:GDP-mannose pyrophosphatase n=1 Tax=Sediminicola luteus TaxID=319238 RepID=A0A2A4G9N8_9FLAO|nr:NUDIX domain-containing protein [Sediminicola luteus]PCE64688.1 GDP-mannose pyrophosphatase [Sediminicola luteus]